MSVLLYADDMVLMSSSREELAAMLQVMDKVSAGLGLRINASKTEIMSIPKVERKKGRKVDPTATAAADPPEAAAADPADPAATAAVQPMWEAEQISEGVVKDVSQFKYLGSMLVVDGKLDVELGIRRGRAYGRFKQFEKLWGAKHLSVSTKVKCYRAYVLPILLFGSETWALTKEQSLMLERVHTSCLRSILGVKLSDRHSNAHVRSVCGMQSLSRIITANRLRWLGHVGRMEPGRLPHIALFSSRCLPHGVRTRAKAGRPRLRWEDCVLQDLAAVGVQEEDWEAECQLKCVWRRKLWEFSHPTGVAASKGAFRASGRRGAHDALQHAEHYSLPFSGSAAAAGELRWWEPVPEPTTFVLNPSGSPPPMFP